MSRARAICEHLAAHPRGVSMGQLREAVDPEGKHGNAVHAQTFQLIAAGKARRIGEGRSATYFPTADTLMDRRAQRKSKPKPEAKARPKKTSTPNPSRRYASAKARKPKPESQPVVCSQRAKANAAAATVRHRVGALPIAPAPVMVPAGFPSHHQIRAAEIAADVAAFERAGGKVQRLRNGDVSRPFQRLFRDEPKPDRTKKSRATHLKPRRADALDDAA